MRSGRNVALLIIGPFEDQDPVRSEVIQAMRSDPRIHLTGPVTDTTPLYVVMDVLALPTYREGLSQTLLEAAAMGLPTVASRVAGCVDPVQDGVTGTLAPARDPRALADALRTYLDQTELRRKHGKAGRDRVLRSFSQSSCGTRIIGSTPGFCRNGRPGIPEDFEFRERVGDSHGPEGFGALRGRQAVHRCCRGLGGLDCVCPVDGSRRLSGSLEDGGPVLFRQVRPGRYGRLFEW